MEPADKSCKLIFISHTISTASALVILRLIDLHLAHKVVRLCLRIYDLIFSSSGCVVTEGAQVKSVRGRARLLRRVPRG